MNALPAADHTSPDPLCPDCLHPWTGKDGHNCSAHGWAWTPWAGLGPMEQASRDLAALGRIQLHLLGRGRP